MEPNEGATAWQEKEVMAPQKRDDRDIFEKALDDDRLIGAEIGAVAVPALMAVGGIAARRAASLRLAKRFKGKALKKKLNEHMRLHYAAGSVVGAGGGAAVGDMQYRRRKGARKK